MLFLQVRQELLQKSVHNYKNSLVQSDQVWLVRSSTGQYSDYSQVQSIPIKSGLVQSSSVPNDLIFAGLFVYYQNELKS